MGELCWDESLDEGNDFTFARPSGRLISRFGSLRLFGGRRFRLLGQVEISAATVAELDVFAAHEDHYFRQGLAHVAPCADLVAHDGDTFLITNAKPVIMTENWERDLGTQFGDLGVDAFARDFTEFNALESDEILHHSVHGSV